MYRISVANETSLAQNAPQGQVLSSTANEQIRRYWKSIDQYLCHTLPNTRALPKHKSGESQLLDLTRDIQTEGGDDNCSNIDPPSCRLNGLEDDEKRRSYQSYKLRMQLVNDAAHEWHDRYSQDTEEAEKTYEDTTEDLVTL
jgi:hypothetical protein